MRTCKTCHHFNWKTIDADNVKGDCESEEFAKSVTMISEQGLAAYGVPDWVSRIIRNSMRVNENFGCIHHQKRLRK